ncbi:MAG: hypothetical protein MUE70_01340 [Desulfobacterales bacterium]|nr:hypothetical protein [Desulfobacterales bacterium]
MILRRIFRFKAKPGARYCGQSEEAPLQALGLFCFAPNGGQSEDSCEKFFKMIFIRRFFLPAILICVLLAVACGRKDLPLPPKIIEPPVVEKIKADLNGDKLQLTWPIPKTDEADALAGFYVYRSKEKAGAPPCSQCPVRFDRAADIAYDSVSLMIEKNAVYSEKLEKGCQYKYRVTTYSAYGDEGLPSEEVTVIY